MLLLLLLLTNKRKRTYLINCKWFIQTLSRYFFSLFLVKTCIKPWFKRYGPSIKKFVYTLYMNFSSFIIWEHSSVLFCSILTWLFAMLPCIANVNVTLWKEKKWKGIYFVHQCVFRTSWKEKDEKKKENICRFYEY